jgi:hypothetical protein
MTRIRRFASAGSVFASAANLCISNALIRWRATCSSHASNTFNASDIKARLPGFMPPPVLSGTIEDHRPDFTCRQTDSQHTPIILEIVTPDMVEDPATENRWSLLASAAKLYNAELHFVVPKWSPIGSVDPALKRRLARMELTANRVWMV